MRPLRFLLLLVFFVALPIGLTCWSIFSASDESAQDSFHARSTTRSSRLRALFSFSTPSSLFPPSAVISLTNDNSTFFLARPAAFGPGLPSKGLSGQLWVGKGFGDDALLKEENIHIVGWELGCSDVPGWEEEASKRIQNLPTVGKGQIKSKQPRDLQSSRQSNEAEGDGSTTTDGLLPADDGTDDYLHHPLADSNPATPGQPGEPANIDPLDKTKAATHADIESLQESADIAGKIVMLSRGGCGFLEKVKWAQRRGGVALIVGDNERGGQLTIMYAKGDTSNVTIPAVFTSYTSAHLLSSLVPPELGDDEEAVVKGSDKPPKGSQTPDKGANRKQEAGRPVFTSTKPGTKQPTIVPAGGSGSDTAPKDNNWVNSVLSKVGLSENSPFSHGEDSRRPPSSGNIDWVLVEDWDDELSQKPINKAGTAANVGTMSTSALKAKYTTSKRIGGDDFVIGVQDWRDSDLVAPKPTLSSADANANTRMKNEKDAPGDISNTVKASTDPEASLKGGSITPGSGEYDYEKSNPPNRFHRANGRVRHDSSTADSGQEKVPGRGSWLDFFKSEAPAQDPSQKGESNDGIENKVRKGESIPRPLGGEDELLPGLWVTLTPTSVSTSPFFDTLLVLVVSPLVTLTVVYGLLLLRSRIRRRRWRAPKSVVERLPVRTYHTISAASSTTSSQVASPDGSSPTSPLLMSSTQNGSQRPRPRSQTTTGIFPAAAADSPPQSRSPTEKAATKLAKRKRYTGRQLECVVCLEDYVDGESQVMSLPCGHEFHAECITPWLVNRRRTCPICKGDVVRSLAHASLARFDDETIEGGQTSDDIQDRVAQTSNEEPSAAIPILSAAREGEMRGDVDEDVERGHDADAQLLGGSVAGQQPGRGRQSAWRNLSASVNRLSGETLWRQTPVDRDR
ncbi:hypothetical protein A1O1_05817 [Capronia coronata CBS 617.96]|uniref:RING-type E3 ubiquitin transferase n=1 Tax=Capronia coronata CBS 617.96 TaxID=1182541 RepID=W9XZ13_9EURO|nr:uncharacterized protein A1O1_05817 [Capronia coronata CBS 617.96]EXJ85453.1 hypothetical protein A1O1_05817 [Capronia coronata CBS 617.96]